MEQVVRLEERVAFRLADYRLADGTSLALADTAFAGLPGILFDTRDEEGAVWLRVERMARRDPQAPPADLAPWLALGPDPASPPALVESRIETVSAEVRNALLASGEADEEEFAAVPERPDGPDGAPRFDRRLAASATTREAAARWIATEWQAWAEAERPRRRTIALYGSLYKLQQQLEIGGAESAVEAVWGIGPVHWTADGRTIDRPLIERFVELELEPDGCLLVRPRAAAARVDLRPYEELGCPNLAPLDALLRAEIARAGEDEGVSPFRPDSFAPMLSAAATRLAPHGRYVTRAAADGPVPACPESGAEPPSSDLVVTDGFVLFARPRSRHVVLDDIARLRDRLADRPTLGGLAARLVAPPSDVATGAFTPLADRLGALEDAPAPAASAPSTPDVFFPKPFNDDQVAIVRRLAGADGLVVQGPPGTGKTHTIANLICHAMALGQRVLVVSRGEAALAVLRDQLPEKVRPLAISILSSERQGLRQVETAIREIQSAVEESRPEIRRSAIRRCEAEILKTRDRIAAIDAELDAIADRQLDAVGPDRVAPADLARSLAAARDICGWFEDRPRVFASETALADADVAALAAARRAAGDLLDHLDAELPSSLELPDAETVAAWHDDLRTASAFEARTAAGPAGALRLPPALSPEAERWAKDLRASASSVEAAAEQPWLTPLLLAAATGEASPWLDILGDIAAVARAVEAERVRLAPFAVALPDRLHDDEPGRAAVSRAASGERPWGRLAMGQALSKSLVAEVRVRGLPPGEDATLWSAARDMLALGDARRALDARWRSFAGEAGGNADDAAARGPWAAVRALDGLERADAALAGLAPLARQLPGLDALVRDPDLARALADGLDDAASANRLRAVDASRTELAARFAGADRTSRMARRLLADIVGREDVETARVGALWGGLLDGVAAVSAAADAFATVRAITGRIAAAGAPRWADRLRREAVGADADDRLLPTGWREAWDYGAAEAHFAGLDDGTRLGALSRERESADRRVGKLFTELVRERAFLALDSRLSPRVKSALVEFVRALGRLGKGTGKGAGRHRGLVRDAMERCYDAVPCWIMPTWRVAEQLPSDLAGFDLVILDEASQSDVTELPAILRGRTVLAVGDDRQVSPTPPFVSSGKLEQLRHRYLRGLPFASLLEPGESLYDLLRAVYPDSRLMLKEHFRCVEPIIRFSTQFYPETLVPLRVPSAAERIDPPLVDILVPHGARDGARKINRAEAQAIVDEIAALADDPRLKERSVGVISLIGAEQAELVRAMLGERIGEEAMQRHAILCGDSATFQGNERDIVFLSMVADRRHRSTLTMLRYEQRFNVAASRARDRLVLVRSVELDDLNPKDLKARLIAHFADPLPARAAAQSDPAALCESGFERDVLARLVALGYRVEPQVGSEGFRIDLVVEGRDGRRLAVECDGDGFHGPDRWREDMRRQRVLERVGWQFWRCFASTFYRDPEGMMADLVEALRRAGVEPADAAQPAAASRLVERRVVPPPARVPGDGEAEPSRPAPAANGIRVGDRAALVFADRRRLTIRLTDDVTDEARGLVGRDTPLGRALAGAEEGDEVDVALPSHSGRALVEAVERADRTGSRAVVGAGGPT